MPARHRPRPGTASASPIALMGESAA